MGTETAGGADMGDPVPVFRLLTCKLLNVRERQNNIFKPVDNFLGHIAEHSFHSEHQNSGNNHAKRVFQSNGPPVAACSQGYGFFLLRPVILCF
jgi:hypothetical protein